MSLVSGKRSALCLGHPGHEIKVLAWAAKYKPVVTIFTDGSGPNRPSRLESTRKVLLEAGCEPATLFGNLKDREIYLLMKEGAAPFVAIAEALFKEWKELDIGTVAGDAMEGFNTTHDVCRMVINAVVEKGRRQQDGCEIRNLSFPLESLALPQMNAGAEVIEMDEAMFQWKRSVVQTAYPEMAHEVDRAIAKYGEAPFRSEVLLPAPEGRAGVFWSGKEIPFYEVYGARQIEKGLYQDLITYREHLLPIAEGLWQWACSDVNGS